MPSDPEGQVIALSLRNAKESDKKDQLEALENIRNDCYENLGPKYALDERKYWAR